MFFGGFIKQAVSYEVNRVEKRKEERQGKRVCVCAETGDMFVCA